MNDCEIAFCASLRWKQLQRFPDLVIFRRQLLCREQFCPAVAEITRAAVDQAKIFVKAKLDGTLPASSQRFLQLRNRLRPVLGIGGSQGKVSECLYSIEDALLLMNLFDAR